MIEGVFPSQPIEILYKINTWLQKWQVLLKKEDRARLDDKLKTIQQWVKGFLKEKMIRPSAVNEEDSFICSSKLLPFVLFSV